MPGHLACYLLVVAGTGEEFEEFFVRKRLVALDGASQLAIELRDAHTPNRGLHGRDKYVRFTVCKTPESDRAIF